MMVSRRHYLTLDALRGVAAFAVLIYHQQRANFMGHGYLAVDFFFILSGFVVAKAYEHKLLTNMRFRDFAVVRASRLYPLLIAATLLSTAYMGMSSIRRGGNLSWLILFPAAALALPDPTGTFAPDPFPLLPVVWSLFFELVANFLYAANTRWLSDRWLITIIGVSGLILAFAMIAHGNAELGNTYCTLWAGMPRVLFSFLAGVLMFRLETTGLLLSIKVPPFVLAAILFGLLAMPHHVPWLFDAACIFLVFPMLLMVAIKNEPSPKWKNAARIAADVSYPLYLFHLPLMLWLSFLLSHFGIRMVVQHALELVAVPALAYGSYWFFDRPFQSVLKRRIASSDERSINGIDARAL